jgi:TfoX/Sxy family transcriptional regulator of competence genes
MACTTDYIDFVCSQIEGVGVIRTKKMFGDWMIYIDEKPVILACDDICYVKMLPVISDMMTNAWTGFPYDGAKEHYILDIEHRDEAIKVIKAILPVIPDPKKRKK